ncbi:F-box protein CPR1-like protein [Tanacetum coccineum]|uniref:F-box protein CPR1-like protein n=1 Tax=Tanacetum coccineum TaxID=301880 RepID=A0ABQ5F428_9ASTR
MGISHDYEQILKRLDVKDLIRCKSVCKSWHSLISTSDFIKTHLNHSYINNEFRHRRIVVSRYGEPNKQYDSCFIVGSSNGLVCIKTSIANVLVANPSSREVKKLQTPWFPRWSSSLCWGFGYNLCKDDYKVILGVSNSGDDRTCFQMLELISNVWKDIGQVEYTFISNVGALYNGTLYWFMNDRKNNKNVILSFDLSKEEFKEVSQPDDDVYNGCMDDNISLSLGVVKEGLCIYESRLSPSSKKWVTENNSMWKLMKRDDNDDEMEERDVVHYLRPMRDYVPQKSFLSHIDVCSSKSGAYIGSPIFVQSLVSPHVNVNDRLPKRKRQKSEEDDNCRRVKVAL